MMNDECRMMNCEYETLSALGKHCPGCAGIRKWEFIIHHSAFIVPRRGWLLSTAKYASPVSGQRATM